jgi:hypothetical protein
MREGREFFAGVYGRRMIIAVVMAALMSTAHADSIPPDIAVRIIIGEAADQGLKGMICTAEVLRRRASIKGFYGYKSNWIYSQPRSVWEMAAEAWKESAYTNYTKGADHFENVHRFGEPWWARYCVKIYEYKDHVFYKEVRDLRV